MAKRSRAEKKGNKPKLSPEAESQVQAITADVVPVSFSKQQRKEVQQAIEKGMAKIRTQAKSNNRERDKKYKHLQKQLAASTDSTDTNTDRDNSKPTLSVIVPWSLLLVTWMGIALYFLSIF